MTPITSASQQHQTYQNQMLTLQFSSHPRPNFVTIAASSGEPETAASSVPYPGWSGAPQEAWQPAPFVPLASSVNDTAVSSPSLAHSPAAAVFVTVTVQSSQDPQTISTEGIVCSVIPHHRPSHHRRFFPRRRFLTALYQAPRLDLLTR
jgi:hypothetical protein